MNSCSDWLHLNIDHNLGDSYNCQIREVADDIRSVENLGSGEPALYLNEVLAAHAEEDGEDDEVTTGFERTGGSIMQ